MSEKTKAQSGWLASTFSAFNPFGWMPWRNDKGVTMLPQEAALLGSGGMTGENPYVQVLANGLGIGGVGGLGLNINGMPFPGTFTNYRIILKHPTCALARAAVTLPVLSSPWMYTTHSKKAPEKAKELLESFFEEVRLPLMMQCLRCLDYGFQAFELVWGDNDDGWRVPVKIKPLLPDLTQLLVDENGELYGIRNGGVDLNGNDYLVISWNVEGSNWYGQGRVENIRRAWANWLKTDDQADRLGQKASGVLPMVGYPADTKTKESSPDQKTNYDRAVAMAYGMMQMRPVVYKNFAGLAKDNDAEAVAKLADKSDWSPKVIEMGNCGPSQAALDVRQRYLDSLIIRGWEVPERAVIEAQTAGSRADSEQQTATLVDTGTDFVNAMIAAQINKQLTRKIMAENFGEKAAGTACVKPREIVDEKRVVVNQFLAALLADPMLKGEAFERVDVDALMEETGIKMREDARPFDEMPTQEKKQDQQVEHAAALHEATGGNDKPKAQ